MKEDLMLGFLITAILLFVAFGMKKLGQKTFNVSL